MITPTGLGQTSMIIQTVFGVTASYLNASQGVYIDLPSSSAIPPFLPDAAKLRETYNFWIINSDANENRGLEAASHGPAPRHAQ